MDRCVVAIDLGGTKASLALVTPDGRVLHRLVLPAPKGLPVAAVEAFAAAMKGWPELDHANAAGMAMPAIVDDDGRVTWAAASAATWQDADASRLLEGVLGVPARVLFDGYAATLGEAVFGPGQGRESLVALIIGTGFGAGTWRRGEVLRGSAGVAGAVGWTRWPTAEGGLGPPIEELVSGPGIVAAARARAQGARARARPGQAPAEVPPADPGEVYADARAVFRAAKAGDPVARAVIEEAACWAGAAAGAMVNAVAPEVVVWTGGVGSRADFSALATRTARRCCQPFAAQRTEFVRSRLGAESSLLGAAAAALAIAKGRPDP
jgi:glucokinase